MAESTRPKSSLRSQVSDKNLQAPSMTHSHCEPKSFRKLPTWVVFNLLVFWNTPLSSSEPTYKWRDPKTNEGLVCKQCPPGTFVAQYCTKDWPTQCQPCPDLHYTQYWNYLDKCLYCSSICSGLEEEVQPCRATHDRVCQCKPGYYLERYSEFCLPHTTCPQGSGVIQPGTPHEDTQCAECPPKTFSNGTGTCQPHTNCSENGLKLNVPGNQFHDALCTACELNQTNEILEQFEEGSASPDCKQAFIDFVVYQTTSQMKLQFLKEVVEEESLPKEDRNNLLQLQAEIYSFLTRVRNTPMEALVTKGLLWAFRQPQLHRVKRRLEKRFSLKVRDLMLTR